MNRPSFNYFAPLAVILATLFFLSGCLPDKEKAAAAQRERLQKQVMAANELLHSGQSDRAIEQLTRLEKDNPNNLAVVEALGFAYSQKPDPLMAALYFEHAFELAPTQAELALFAAQANAEVSQHENAADYYRAYLKLTPGDADSWRKLGALETRLQRHQPALSAYLEALRLSGNTPTSAEQLTLARLYHNLGNQPQATRWYEAVLANKKAPPEERADALLGQFDLALRQKSWDQAIALMNELDTLAPGTLQNGPYSQAHDELTRWDTARREQATAAQAAAAAAAAQVAKQTSAASATTPATATLSDAVTTTEATKTADSTTAAGAATTAEVIAANSEKATAATVVSASSSTATEGGTGNTSQTQPDATATVATTAATESPASGQADPATATTDTTEATDTVATSTTAATGNTTTAAAATSAPTADATAAVAPSLVAAATTKTANSGSSGTIGSSSKLPSEDETTASTGAASAATATTGTITAANTTLATSTTSAATTATVTDADDSTLPQASAAEGELAQKPAQPAPPVIEDAATELSLAQDASAAELAARGTEFFEAGNFEQAAELLERSVKLNPGNAAVLDMLSRASYRIGKFPQAERYATLATYAEPENLAYRLEFLRAYQRNNAPTLLLQQLISAKADFPDSPPVTLALARGYEYIANKKSLAAGIYREYLEQDPKSPLAGEIRQKLLEWEL